MKELAGKLLALDEKARLMVEEASAYRDSLRESLANEEKQILGEFNEHAEMHIQTVRDTEATVAAEETSALDERYRELAARIEAQYEEHHGEWEDQLFRRCTENEAV